MKRLEGKLAVVTGGGTGIGRATAELFIEEGARVIVVGRRSEFLDIPGCLPIHGDITRDASRIMADAKALKESLDILVNNAAYMKPDGDVSGIERANLTETLNVNVYGTMLMTREAFPLMKDKGGSIVNVASILAHLGGEGLSSYTASKGAILALTRQFAIEGAPYGIRVNSVSPTLTEGTPMSDDIDKHFPELKGQLMERHPLGRLPNTRDIAQAILYFASDESRCVTGQDLIIDCGRSIYGG
jgi:3alpha(or 20beta)-hydroxysteroid dehydrogenase